MDDCCERLKNELAFKYYLVLIDGIREQEYPSHHPVKPVPLAFLSFGGLSTFPISLNRASIVPIPASTVSSTDPKPSIAKIGPSSMLRQFQVADNTKIIVSNACAKHTQ